MGPITLGVEPKNIKASVVTVCFNSVKTIEQTLQSILGQNYGNIEYIVIDGGSTDGTVDIIKKYENDIDYWVSEPDHGIYDAMNKGIAKATGDIIGFMNSDDWYAEGAISAIAEAFGQTDADIVYGNTILVDNGIQSFRSRPPLNRILHGMVFCHQAAFVKTTLMKENPFNISYRIVADFAFFLEMYLQKKRFCPIDTTIAYFRTGGNSSHPWKLFQEVERASLRLSKGRIDAERYRKLREDFQEKKVFPMLRFLFTKIERLATKENGIAVSPLGNRKFVLYGAGKLGREVLEMMKKLGLDVLAFWDSDVKKQGTEADGIPILCPQRRNQQKQTITILISTTKGSEEIVRKLEVLGYENGEDFFEKAEWLGWLAGAWLGKGG